MDMSTCVRMSCLLIFGWMHKLRRLLRQRPVTGLNFDPNTSLRYCTNRFNSSMHCCSSLIVRVQ